MSRLHQVLAIESDLEGKYKRTCEETKKVFGKASMFTGSHRTLELFDDSDTTKYPDEHLAMTTTVKERVAYTSEAISDYLDALFQKEATNQEASADLTVNGVSIGMSLPATFLLALESRLKYIRSIYEALPTLQSGIEWKPSTDKGEGIWDMVHPEEKIKTKMAWQHQVLVPPTKEHRAEIEKWEEQLPVGKFVKHVWCSLLTSHEKSEVLGRIDKLIQAVKQARQRANTQNIVKGNVGKSIMQFINEGK